MSGALPEDWDEEIPDLTAAESEDATRGWSGKILQGVARRVPNLIGGSADLAGSNKTTIDGADNLLPSTPGGRNLHYGIREHAMASIMNGMALHGGVRPFGGTFLIFSDYMRPAIRLAALMGQSVIYIFTHDSIGLGEDGPTHQPVEQLAALRAIPNLCDLRPGDAAETEVAWRVALERTEGPSFLALTRQKVVLLNRGDILAEAEGVRRGGYVLAEASTGTPEVILIASGSELGIALEARERLETDGTPTRVVSLPSWYLFGQQERSYRDNVLPPGISNKISVEAASTFGWARWVGASGYSLGLDHFGASAPSDVLFEKFGFTVERIVKAVRNSPTL
jgi:transketolase